MEPLREIPVADRSLEPFERVVRREDFESHHAAAAEARRALVGRTVWNVNSTAVGGGVAEMLRALLPYARGLGVDARWLVFGAEGGFFRLTKRIHHALHESRGDGAAMDGDAARAYEAALAAAGRALREAVRPGDAVVLHDPQTAGLAPWLAESGAALVWRCHVGTERPGAEARSAWAFLAPYLAPVHRTVFSCRAYVPGICDPARARIIPPSLDAFSPKNQPMDAAVAYGVLARVGVLAPAAARAPAPRFVRSDGSEGLVRRRARVRRCGPPPDWDTPLAVQVSRWDPLKDPAGVLQGFASAAADAASPAQLVLAGPDAHAVSDDPEGAATLEATERVWSALPEALRARVHLVSLPADDLEENAAMVNALQRHAAVVVQKSLREGFGLTVTEALWKGRPVLASAVGGIPEQIEDGRHGVLLPDPGDLEAFGHELFRLLAEPERAAALAKAGRARARERFLALRHLRDWARLLLELV